MIWGVVVGVVVGLVAYWLLGSMGGAIRLGGAAVVALAVGFFVQKASFKSGAKSAECQNCGAAFSLSRSDRTETVTGSEAKEERETGEDGTKTVKTWVEESVDVVETYTCSSCGDETTKAYSTTRRRDEETKEYPAEAAKAAPEKGGKKSSGKTGDDAGGRSRGGRGRG